MNDFYKAEIYDGSVIASFYMDGKPTEIYVSLNEDISFLSEQEQKNVISLNNQLINEENLLF